MKYTVTKCDRCGRDTQTPTGWGHLHLPGLGDGPDQDIDLCRECGNAMVVHWERNP